MGAGLTLAAIGFGTGVAKGIAGYQAYNEQAGKYDEEGYLLQNEAYREAARIEDEGDKFAAKQKLAYIGSGVEIGGSAVVTLAQTDKWAATEAEAVRTRGDKVRAYYKESGRLTRRQGVAEFLSGIGDGVAAGVNLYSKAGAGLGSGAGFTPDRSPYGTGTNRPTAAQLRRPGATVRKRP